MKSFLIPAFFVIDTSVDENEAVKIAAEMQTWANAHGANFTNAHLLLDEELPNREVDIDPEETELPHTYNNPRMVRPCTRIFSKGESVDVKSRKNDIFHDFTGTIKEINNEYVVVEDQDGDCFSVDPEQLSYH
jgi:hypothetical protein